MYLAVPVLLYAGERLLRALRSHGLTTVRIEKVAVYPGNVIAIHMSKPHGFRYRSGQYIYVQELPSRFNTDMVWDCEDLSPSKGMCKYTANGGFGPRLWWLWGRRRRQETTTKCGDNELGRRWRGGSRDLEGKCNALDAAISPTCRSAT